VPENEWEMLANLDAILPKNVILLAHNCSFEQSTYNALFEYCGDEKNIKNSKFYLEKFETLKKIRISLQDEKDDSKILQFEKRIIGIQQSLRYKSPIRKYFNIFQGRNVIHVDTRKFIEYKRSDLKNKSEEALGKLFFGDNYQESHRAYDDCRDLHEILMILCPEGLMPNLQNFLNQTTKGVFLDLNSDLKK
jgi:hypothetical protein